MNGPLRILYVDDYPLDRELVRDALEKEHGGFQVVEAASRAELEARLAEGGYDLVLSDFNILGYEGLQVLDAVHAQDPRVPVVIATGTGSEEIAVEAMKRGAADYVIKTPKHIRRLPQTIQAVLEKRRLQAERERARAEVEHERDLLTALMDNIPDAIYFKDVDSRFTRVNRAQARRFGLDDPAQMLGQTDFDIQSPELAREFLAEERRIVESGQPVIDRVEFNPTADGKPRWLSATKVPTRDAEGRVTGIVGISRDITERKRAEEKIERQLQRLAALRQIDQAITTSFDLHIVLNILLEQAIKHLQVDAVDILLFEPYTRVLSFAVGRGFSTDAIRQTRLRLGEGLVGRAALERRLVKVPDVNAAGGDFAQGRHLAGEGFAAYFSAPLVAKGQIKGTLEIFHRSPLDPGSEWLDFLETLAGQAAIAADNAQLFDGMQRSNVELALAYDATIEGWSRALDLRDKETEGHTQRATEITLRLAQNIGIVDAELVHVRRGVLLHDIGKMGVPDGILLKPGPLNEAEWAIMRRHPQFAYDMLSPIAYLRQALDIPYCHHEKWDGTGYPRGLKGEQIPLAARIFAVVDVWDALRSDRPYRPGWPEERVRAYLREQTGKHFEPRAVEAFFTLADPAEADKEL